MYIDVIFSAGEAKRTKLEGCTAVVIDVLRATSVMVTALQNGAMGIWPVLSPEEGHAFRKKEKSSKVILGGERCAEHIPGFDFGNSPLDYTRENVSGKMVVMTTTNGTRALDASMQADEILVAAFLNAEATARHLTGRKKVSLICSGSNDAFTLEDALCAGYITECLVGANPSATISDAALALHQLFMSHRDNYQSLASDGRHYRLLQSKGLTADLDYCFQRDTVPVICHWKGPERGIVLV